MEEADLSRVEAVDAAGAAEAVGATEIAANGIDPPSAALSEPEIAQNDGVVKVKEVEEAVVADEGGEESELPMTGGEGTGTERVVTEESLEGLSDPSAADGAVAVATLDDDSTMAIKEEEVQGADADHAPHTTAGGNEGESGVIKTELASAPATAAAAATSADAIGSAPPSSLAPQSLESVGSADESAYAASTAVHASLPVKQEDDAAASFLKETFESFAKQSTAAAQASNPLGHTDVLRKRIERDRRDGDAWLGLIDDAMQRADLQELRKVYEDFFAVYPNAARQWQDYASMELSHSEFGNVESIFTRCLRTTPSTDLWRFYLSYTRRVNPLPPAGKGSSSGGEDSDRERTRKVIEGAYEFALRFIGHSRDAGDVWRDYIALLKERETSNQWQAGQKMDDIRRTYQRAVAIPLANVEQIWREYDAYENGLNRITAKKFLADRSAAYMTARGVLREMRTLTDNLHRPIIPRVPCWAMSPSLDPIVSPLTIVRDRHHVESWKKYLRWEESNPLQIEDVQALQLRILMAYRKAAMHMRFYPEIWYMASVYLQRNGRDEEAVAWLRNGLEACAGSSLLTFAFVEQAEKHGQTQECGSVFNNVLEWHHGEIERIQSQSEDRIRAIDEEADRQKAEAAARKRDEGASEVIEGEEREGARKMEEQREERRQAERERVRPKIEELKEFASLVWIKYMHFVRRTEGQRPSRAIFARARKSKYCTWQVFEANALMEYHCSKDVSVATKVFELALKTYGDDEAFVVRYLDFLLSVNDDNNARALFERTVGSFKPDRARPIWDRWSEYEYSFGDTASIARIEERLAQIYPEEHATKRLLNRNSYMDLDVVGPRDLGLRSTGVPGGASAAERAVTASKELAQEASGAPLPPSGPRAEMGLHSVPEEGVGPGGDAAMGPQAKRARFGRDGVSPTPPPAARPIPTGPRGTKRSVSPPSRFVPPPRGEPPSQPGGAAPAAAQQPAPPAYLELPDGILYFLDALPNAASFDGPRFSAEDIIECIVRSSLPTPDLSKTGAGGGPVPSGRGGFQGQQGGGFRPRRGFARGGRRF